MEMPSGSWGRREARAYTSPNPKKRYIAPDHLVYKIRNRAYVYENMKGWWQLKGLPNRKGLGSFYTVDPPTMWAPAEEVSSDVLLRKYVELLDNGKVTDGVAMYHAIRLLTGRSKIHL